MNREKTIKNITDLIHINAIPNKLFVSISMIGLKNMTDDSIIALLKLHKLEDLIEREV